MPLSAVLLDPRVRARLDLNDEQVKKIQEIAERGGDVAALNGLLDAHTVRLTLKTESAMEGSMVFLRSYHQPSRDEILKVLTPQQRTALERLSGTPVEPKK
jgi:hypothetical protein